MNLYQITLNWYGELLVLHTRASSPKQALNNGIRKAAIRLGRSLRHVRAYFLDETKDRWLVQELKEIKDDQ
jgi:hypothetical protein